MSERSKTRRQRFVTLLTTTTFAVLSVTGVIAFAQPFSIRVVGLHAFTGFLFVALVALHVAASSRAMARHLRSRTLWSALAITALLAGVLWWQPKPVRALLGLSANLGPALDRFEFVESGMVYRYAPDPGYRMSLEIRTGPAYDAADPPRLAIWLENQSHYHIKTLHAPESEDREARLPYWAAKVRGWRAALEEAERSEGGIDELVHAVSSPTENNSFDPADYILPGKAESPLPYRLLIEINQPGDATESLDDQPSLVYQVVIDNHKPRTFQLLGLVGYPVEEEARDGGEAEWALYYIDERFDSALELIDSALLTIERGE
jgi:hypothetical protein